MASAIGNPADATVLRGVGLTLGGGGLHGFGVMVGFASALELFFVSHDVSDFESFSGLSAGAILSAYIGAGISPLEILQAQLTGVSPSGFIPARRSDFFQPNLSELAATPLRLGRAIARATRRLWRAAEEGAPAVLGLLPSGVLRNDRLARLVRKNLERRGADDFKTFPRRFATCFYDLLRNERVTCGTDADAVSDLPVHEAVVASSTIPAIFTPRRVKAGGRAMLAVDGGTGGATISTDAAERLSVLISYHDSDYLEREEIEHASAIAVLSMAYGVLRNQQNMEQIVTFMDRHPAEHVIPFQTPAGASGGLISWDSALRAMRPAFERTKRELAELFDYFALVFEQRGVRVNPEIGEASFEDAVRKGREAKRELRRRHGLAA